MHKQNNGLSPYNILLEVLVSTDNKYAQKLHTRSVAS